MVAISTQPFPIARAPLSLLRTRWTRRRGAIPGPKRGSGCPVGSGASRARRRPAASREPSTSHSLGANQKGRSGRGDPRRAAPGHARGPLHHSCHRLRTCQVPLGSPRRNHRRGQVGRGTRTSQTSAPLTTDELQSLLDLNRMISPAPTRRYSFGNSRAQACVETVSRHHYSIGESAVAGDQSWLRPHVHRRPE